MYATIKTEDGSSAELTAGQVKAGISESICVDKFSKSYVQCSTQNSAFLGLIRWWVWFGDQNIYDRSGAANKRMVGFRISSFIFFLF